MIRWSRTSARYNHQTTIVTGPEVRVPLFEAARSDQHTGYLNGYGAVYRTRPSSRSHRSHCLEYLFRIGTSRERHVDGVDPLEIGKLRQLLAGLGWGPRGPHLID